MFNKLCKYYTIIIEPNYHVWRNKNPDEDPVREIKVKLSAENIKDAKEKVWKAINLDPEVYEIISIYTDGFFNRYQRYTNDD